MKFVTQAPSSSVGTAGRDCLQTTGRPQNAGYATDIIYRCDSRGANLNRARYGLWSLCPEQLMHSAEEARGLFPHAPPTPV